MEMNCGKLKKYAFRVTKNRNMLPPVSVYLVGP